MKRSLVQKGVAGSLNHAQGWLRMKMRRPVWTLKGRFKCITVVVMALCFIYLIKVKHVAKMCDTGRIHKVNPDHAERAQKYAEGILRAACRPSFTKAKLRELFPDSYKPDLPPFVTEEMDVLPDLFRYKPPFGFRHLGEELRSLVQLLPEFDLPAELRSMRCKRCVVVGSSNVLRGLQLGSALNRFDVVIRLNDAPVRGYTQDVGNKMTIRMTYPEGAPLSQEDYFPNSLFVAVLFKTMDFAWIKAVVKNETLPLWKRLFFWKKVATKIPMSPRNFRILNPLIIKETALDVLQYPESQNWFFWDQNIPTMGIMATFLATHLCDEVSLAGFGYDLRHPETPLHYYDSKCMDAMKWQIMHNLSLETRLLQKLVREGAVSDLSGGIDCHFCKKPG